MQQLSLSLNYIQQVLAEYSADKPVKRVQVFGSCARAKATAESDLDLLLAMEYPVGFIFFNCTRNLEDRLGIKVDVGTAVSGCIIRYIQRDLKTIHEREQRQVA